MRRSLILAGLAALGLGGGAAWAGGAPHLWGDGQSPGVPDPATLPYYAAQDDTGQTVAHAYKRAQVFLQVSSPAVDYWLIANGRIFSYDAAQRSFVFTSAHAILEHADDHGRSVVDCSAGKLIAGGDEDGRWVAEVTFPACGPLPGRQFIAAKPDDGSRSNITIDPIR